MKRLFIAGILLASLSGCVTAGVVIAGLGTAAMVAQDSLASYCTNSTNEAAKAKAGCPVVEE
jgi:hypothetical protein